MSGSSRIGGYGGQCGTGGGSGRSAALARFCRGRKKGDVVSGVFLRLETEDLGWARLEGEELLAHLPASGVRPVPGDRVFFMVESLAPEVVLRMLAPDSPAARLAVLVPPLPLSQQGVLYAAARDRLDALLTTALRRDPDLFSASDPGDRKAAFVEHVASDGALFEAFAETRARSRELERLAEPAGLLFFRHMPWLCGGLSRVEVSLWRCGEAPVLVGARLPSGDGVLLRGEMDGGRLRYRLTVVGPGGACIFPERTARDECRGAESRVSEGRAAPATDLVGRVLALAAESGSMALGRFSRKL